MNEGKEKLRVLVFGAHPDDCDIRAGGVAAKYARLGHHVKMVSVTNGDAGHHAMGGAPLAWRRRQEAAAAGERLGVEYTVLDHHDAELMPTLSVRAEIVRIIRDFRPDLVMAPRLWDYHPDHRATAQLVMDAMYLSTVPNFCSDTPHLARMPVAMYVWDGFQRPYPFSPDVVIDIDDAFEAKLEALHCHASQVYEWLPYNRRVLDEVPVGDAERRKWLRAWLHPRSAQQAAMYRSKLAERYGDEKASVITAAEAFEVSEYGMPLTDDEAQRLFPF